MDSLNELAKEIHTIAVEKGFYDVPATFVEKLYLVASEIFEAGDAWIKRQDDEIAEELADVLIRLLDCWHAYWPGDIDDVVAKKIAANRQRQYMHGNKRL